VLNHQRNLHLAVAAGFYLGEGNPGFETFYHSVSNRYCVMSIILSLRTWCSLGAIAVFERAAQRLSFVFTGSQEVFTIPLRNRLRKNTVAEYRKFAAAVAASLGAFCL